VTMEAQDAVAARELAGAMVEALREGQIDEAEALLHQVCSLVPDAEELLTFPVLIAIQRGQVREALQLLNAAGEDHSPELRALCLYLLGDPTWHGEATALLASPDENVRQAMQQLLGGADDRL
jgi:type III secretion protein HrpB1